MYVSLEQAIEIHGRALKHRKGAAAGAATAQEQASRCKAKGDDEGFEIWSRVSEAVVRLQQQSELTAQH